MPTFKPKPTVTAVSDKKASPSLPPQESLTDELALRLGTRSLLELRGTLNAKEVWAVGCLVAYVAETNQMDGVTVWSILTAYLGVEDIHELPAQRYDDAVAFLVDFDPARLIN